jgi:hypothetical protein
VKKNLEVGIESLINQADSIAPSISLYESTGSYGSFNDQDLDVSRFTTWNLQVKSIFEDLKEKYPKSYRFLYEDFIQLQEESKQFHSKSIYVSKAKILLSSAIELLENASKEKQTILSSKPSEAPEKLTLKWLFQHVTVKQWIGCFSILVSVFLAGYSVAIYLVEKGIIEIPSKEKHNKPL